MSRHGPVQRGTRTAYPRPDLCKEQSARAAAGSAAYQEFVSGACGPHDGPSRVDPDTCRCTGCITGYSVPLGQATDADLRKLWAGRLCNATGYPLLARTTVTVGDRTFDLAEEER